MTTPSALAELIRATAAEDAIDERPGLLIVRAALADAALRERWRRVCAQPPADVDSLTITRADSDEALAADATPGPDEVFRISIVTREEPGQLRLFRAASLQRAAARLGDVDQVLIAEMGANETFTTYRNRVQLWVNEVPEPYAASEPLPDPRTYTSDFTGGAEVPGDIRPWMVRTPPAEGGAAYQAWGRVASRYLLAALADRVSRSGGQLAYHFSGPPACAVHVDAGVVVGLLPRLQEGAAWVFGETRDADTRHLLLAAEWARTYRKAEPADLGDGALDSARAAYAAYVKSGSKETLKALADLRKSVVDEGQKASQRAQDLAGAMWKDIAVAAVPFVLKILPDAGKAASATLTIVLALCAAAFLIFSFGIQVFINRRYFRRQEEGREVWKRELNVVLRQKDIEELSETPLRRSVDDYRQVRLIVGLVYAALVGALLTFAWVNLPNDVRAPPKPASAPAKLVAPPSAAGKVPAAAPANLEPPPVKAPKS